MFRDLVVKRGTLLGLFVSLTLLHIKSVIKPLQYIKLACLTAGLARLCSLARQTQLLKFFNPEDHYLLISK